MEYSTQLFTGRSPPSFDMLCALKNYVEKAKKVIFAKMALTGVLSGSDDIYLIGLLILLDNFRKIVTYHIWHLQFGVVPDVTRSLFVS